MIKERYALANRSQNISEQLNFVRVLTDCASDECIQFNFEILTNRTDERFYQMIKSAFRRRGPIGTTFLLNRVKYEQNPELRADAIQILGNLRFTDALQYIHETLNSEIYAVRYASIISMGWMGNLEDVKLLGNRYKFEDNEKLRGFIATAMRQIYFNYPRVADDILETLRIVCANEQSETAQSLIIISIQSITKRAFGLRESIRDGVIKGNIRTAWQSIKQFWTE